MMYIFKGPVLRITEITLELNIQFSVYYGRTSVCVCVRVRARTV